MRSWPIHRLACLIAVLAVLPNLMPRGLGVFICLRDHRVGFEQRVGFEHRVKSERSALAESARGCRCCAGRSLSERASAGTSAPHESCPPDLARRATRDCCVELASAPSVPLETRVDGEHASSTIVTLAAHDAVDFSLMDAALFDPTRHPFRAGLTHHAGLLPASSHAARHAPLRL